MLVEDYRPKSWKEVVGQDAAIARLDILRDRGLSGRAYMITGASGTGKTTIARLLAGEIADRFNVDEMDAGDLTGPRVRDLSSALRTYGMGASVGRVVILNECHGLRRDAIRALLVELEAIPKHAAWIFTTTTDGAADLFESSADAGPLLSRCLPLPLARSGLAEAFADHIIAVAYREGLTIGRVDRRKALALIRHHRNNLRAALQAVEAGVLMGV